ncbi:MAG: protoheme IX farnesyltransferase [Gammaproteobacteria bacterium]|nr:protoheme IX farnesyltransferase [Gammaproteobacteria bacterium]|tara:strand:- start:23 stop:904 length:882 start_codon:yes stop_codon:yes gene_type:complete
MITSDISENLKLIYLAAKVRLGFLIMACTLAGIAVSPASSLSSLDIFLVSFAVLLCSSTAGAFNQLYERDLDSIMSRTKNRPFVTRELEPKTIWNYWLLILSLAALFLTFQVANFEAALFLFAGTFTYGIVYTVWLKRKTWMNIVIGGLAGSFAVLVGSAAAGASFATAPLILSVVLFLWTPPHFWALAIFCKDDYAKASIPMLPVVASDSIAVQAIFWHTLILVLLSFSLIFFGMHWVYLSFAIVGGFYFLYHSIQLMIKKTPEWAKKTFFASIIHLALLLLGTVIDAMIFA